MSDTSLEGEGDGSVVVARFRCGSIQAVREIGSVKRGGGDVQVHLGNSLLWSEGE